MEELGSNLDPNADKYRLLRRREMLGGSTKISLPWAQGGGVKRLTSVEPGTKKWGGENALRTGPLEKTRLVPAISADNCVSPVPFSQLICELSGRISEFSAKRTSHPDPEDLMAEGAEFELQILF